MSDYATNFAADAHVTAIVIAVNEPSPRIAAGLLGLVALWIGVYWWWPSSSQPQGITFSQDIAQPLVAIESTDSNVHARSGEHKQSPKVQGSETGRLGSGSQGAVLPPEPVTPKQGSSNMIPPEFRDHTVAPGETYAGISLKYFGTSAYANAIAKANPLMSPTSLRPGRVIKVPKDPKNVQGLVVQPAADKVNNAPGRNLSTEYIVEPGDTLSRIAQKFYGDTSLAAKIYDANRAVLPDEDSLRVGQKLMLPPKEN